MCPEEQVTTTHNLMAAAINTAACSHNEAQNASRKRKQVEVLHAFLSDMAACGFDMDGDALYSFYCRHSIHHLSTYLPDGAPLPSVRYQPLEWISKGDKVHVKMCEYMRAQVQHCLPFSKDPFTE